MGVKKIILGVLFHVYVMSLGFEGFFLKKQILENKESNSQMALKHKGLFR